MSVVVEPGRVRLVGACGAEDAERLCAALLDGPARPVDVCDLAAAHTAVIQVLMALGPALEGEPADPFLCAHVLPQLRGDSPSRPEHAMTGSMPGGA